MKLSLLDIVQDIANDLDTDEVNSIDDTVEAQQIAQIVKTCYFEMIANRNWPHLRKLIRLDSANDITKPNYLKLPDNVKELVFFKYEKQKLGVDRVETSDVKFKHPDDFLRLVSARSSTANVEEIVDFSGTKLLILNNVAPSFWTSFDDTYIVTDSYDSAVDDTLQSAKSQCLAYTNPTWSRTDGFIPDLPIEAFPLLVEEAKSTASVKLKQIVDQKAEQKAARQQRWLSRKAWRAEGDVRFPDYGRRGKK